MKLVSLIAVLLCGCTLACRAQPEQEPTPSEPYAAEELSAAIESSLPLMQASMDVWVREESCLSCHHQGLGAMAVSVARERGFAIDEASLEDQARRMGQLTPSQFARALQGEFSVNTGISASYLLIGRAAAGAPANHATDAMAYSVAGFQSDSGAWKSRSHRPPLEDSAVTATALSARALSLFGPEGRASEMTQRIARARSWLETVEPRSNEERVMKLLGLGWTGAPADARRRTAADLSDRQRPDGGWAQIPTQESDAYATGQALVALHQFGGLSVGSATYRRGVRFLLDTQEADGSWLVKTRRRSPGLPYFETGFPHRLHQFISFAGTAWGTMALCLALDPGPATAFVGERPETGHEESVARTAGLQPVHSAAAYGPLEDLARILVADPDRVNAPGPGGMTPLMLALHDTRKVELLLERGADLDIASDAGNTALTLAGWYSGADAALERFLGLGAATEAAGPSGMTALLRAAVTGSVGKATALLDHGANLEAAESNEDTTALVFAACIQDVPMLRLLLDRGAHGDFIALNEAAYDGSTELVRELLARGADPNVRDPLDGMTALAWAAKIDHGGPPLVELLLASGGDPSIPANDGKSPLDWAEFFDNRAALEALRKHAASSH